MTKQTVFYKICINGSNSSVIGRKAHKYRLDYEKNSFFLQETIELKAFLSANLHKIGVVAIYT